MSQLSINVTQVRRKYEVQGKTSNLSFLEYAVESTFPRSQLPEAMKALMGTENSTTSSGLTKVTQTVWRRFSDFEWTISTMSDDMPGLLLPAPLDKTKESDGMIDKLEDLAQVNKDKPETKAEEKKPKDLAVTASNGIGQQRLRQLRLTMCSICDHPDVVGSEALFAFLSLSEVKWLEYKEANKKKVLDKVKKGITTIVGKIKNKKHVYDENSKIGKIIAQQADYQQELMRMDMHIGTVVLSDNRKDIENARKFEFSQAKKAYHKLPYPSIYTEHRIASEDQGRHGVIKYIEENDEIAHVQWEREDGEKKSRKADDLCKLPVQDLRCPKSGVSDVGLEVVMEFIHEVDKWTKKMPERNATKQFLYLVDLVRFWKTYTKQISIVSSKILNLHAVKASLEKDLAGCSKPDKRAELQTKLADCDPDLAEERFLKSYEQSFRPAQKAALTDMCRLTGQLSLGMGICDTEWTSRLQSAMDSLPLMFSTPGAGNGSANDDENPRASSPSPKKEKKSKKEKVAKHVDPVEETDSSPSPKKEKKSKKEKKAKEGANGDDEEVTPMEAIEKQQDEQLKKEKKEKKSKKSKKEVVENMSFDNVEAVPVEL